MIELSRRQIDILRIVLDAMLDARRLHVRGIADKLGSPNYLRSDLGVLIQKRCLHMEQDGKEHIYTITKTGRECLAKYERDTVVDLITRIINLGQRQALEKVLMDRTVTRVRCKKCGATDWDEADKKIEIDYEPYDEDIHPDIFTPFYRCTRCGNETIEIIDRESPNPSVELDSSNFIEEEVSIATALQEGWKP